MKAKSIITLVATCAAVAAGCGGGDDETKRSGGVTAETRVEKCVEEYPDSTKADCEEWEQDGQLNDDGTHQDHENM